MLPAACWNEHMSTLSLMGNFSFIPCRICFRVFLRWRTVDDFSTCSTEIYFVLSYVNALQSDQGTVFLDARCIGWVGHTVVWPRDRRPGRRKKLEMMRVQPGRTALDTYSKAIGTEHDLGFDLLCLSVGSRLYLAGISWRW